MDLIGFLGVEPSSVIVNRKVCSEFVRCELEGIKVCGVGCYFSRGTFSLTHILHLSLESVSSASTCYS